MSLSNIHCRKDIAFALLAFSLGLFGLGGGRGADFLGTSGFDADFLPLEDRAVELLLELVGALHGEVEVAVGFFGEGLDGMVSNIAGAGQDCGRENGG